MKVFLSIVITLVIVISLAFAYLGYLPVIGGIFGWDKPKDLGITYSEEDLNIAIEKSGAEYAVLDASTPDESSIQFEGTHETTTSWSSAELSALLNDRPWKHWPVNGVQMRINDDNTVEMTGIVNRERLRGYCTGIGVPSEVIDRLYLMPSETPFYLHATGSLSDNKISTLDFLSVEMGRYSVPTGLLLSVKDNQLLENSYAEDINSELSKYSGKKGYLVDFINEKLAWVSGFFANSAEFSEGSLNFEGSIPDTEQTVR